MKQALLVLAGALAGGVVGYFAFVWLLGVGVYALILPGALLGVGAYFAGNRSVVLAVVCGILAFGLGLFAEWWSFPFAKDQSFGFFLTHAHHLTPLTLILIAIGGVIGFYMPFSNVAAGQWSRVAPPPPDDEPGDLPKGR